MNLDLSPSITIAILLALGFLLFAAEVFLPGLVLGSIGILCVLTAISWSFIGYGAFIGSLTLAASLLLGSIAFLIYLQTFQKLPFTKRLINRAATSDPDSPTQHPLIGKTGISLSPLRPAGTAKIDGRRLDVVAENTFIESGVKIQIIEVEGSRIVVRLS